MSIFPVAPLSGASWFVVIAELLLLPHNLANPTALASESKSAVQCVNTTLKPVRGRMDVNADVSVIRCGRLFVDGDVVDEDVVVGSVGSESAVDTKVCGAVGLASGSSGQ